MNYSFSMSAPWKHNANGKASHKRSYSVSFHLCDMSRKSKSVEPESRFVIMRRRVLGITANGHNVSFLGDKNVLKLDGSSWESLWIY